MPKKTLRELQREEAKERMKLIGLHENVLSEFESDETLYYSEDIGTMGILYWVDNEPEMAERIKAFEKEWDAYVYHAVLTHYAFGDMMTFLYVSNCEEEWEDDKDAIGYKQDDGSFKQVAYVYNDADPDLSELSWVGLKEAGGGLVRTA